MEQLILQDDCNQRERERWNEMKKKAISKHGGSRRFDDVYSSGYPSTPAILPLSVLLDGNLYLLHSELYNDD